MKNTNILLEAALFLAVIILFGSLAPEARATTFIVDTTADDPNLSACTTAPSDCSLRGAVYKVNKAGTGIDRIEFALPSNDTGCTGQGVCTITLTQGLLSIIRSNPTLEVAIYNSTGPGKLIISGNSVYSIFYNDKNSLSLEGITIANAGPVGTGLAITGAVTNGSSLASVTIRNCVVINNNSAGGIISYGGYLYIYDSTITNNAGVNGGGVASYTTNLTIQRSTINGNTATQNGGGVLLSQGNSTIDNSTISGNTAAGGGGIYFYRPNPTSSGSLTLYSSTVTDNTATNTSTTRTLSDSGGIEGVYQDILYFGQRVPVFLSNTIVAGNHNANAPDMWAEMSASSAFNLIGNGNTLIDSSGQTNNQIGTAANPLDPLLGPLADNGGSNKTHALLLGSPAIDKGKAFIINNVSTDQRGLLRTVDLASVSNAADGTDIGAYEAQTLPCGAITLSPSTLPNGYLGAFYNQTVSAAGGGGSYGFSVTNGSLPSGLSLSQDSGIISGTPDSLGAFGFTVTAVEANGCSGAQAYAVNINEPVIFNPPSDLQADYLGTDFINLSWTDNSNSETAFLVELCSHRTCTSATQIGQTGANETTFSVTGLQPNKQYFLRVAAINGDGQKTAYSNILTAKTLKR
jgi:hypothetical protein